MCSMTVFENIKSKNIDELAEWLDSHFHNVYTPWEEWWDENYCSKCPPVKAHCVDCNKELDFGWCELNDGCKFCPDLNDVPDNKQVIKLWLESEVKVNKDE